MAKRKVSKKEAPIFISGVGKRIANIKATCEEWNANAYATANHQLYLILQACAVLNKEIVTEDDNTELNNCFKKLKTRSSTSNPLAQILYCVFGDIGKRRISTYVVALEKGKEQGIAANNFADWIERQHGGLYELSLNKTKTGLTAEEKIAQSVEALRIVNPIATIVSNELGSRSGDIQDIVVMLAKPAVDGSIDVLKVVTKQSVINAALLSFHSEAEDILATAATQQVPPHLLGNLIAKVYGKEKGLVN